MSKSAKFDNECTGAFFSVASGFKGPFELHGEECDLVVDTDLRGGVYDSEGNVLAGFKLPHLPAAGSTRPVKATLLIIGRNSVARKDVVVFAASNSKHALFYQIRPDTVKPVQHDPALLKLLGE